MSTEKTNQEKTDKTVVKYKYVGPAYKSGLILPDGSQIRPLEMSDTEIQDCILRFPQLKEFFSV
jgi:hypothetical protein